MIALNGQQAGAIKKIYDAGHQLASHTYSHSNMDRMTVAQMQKEIRDTDALLLKYAGVRPRYMRAPEGRCGEPCTKAMNDMGLIVSHWNVDTNDWRFAHQDPKRATRNSMVEINDVIIKGSDPKKDSFILLQHELLKFSVELLVDRVIDAILKKGYRFVTMEECIGRPAYIGQPRSPVPDPTTDLTPQPTSVEPTPQPTSTIGTKNIVADNENEDIEISSNNDTSVEPNVANDVKSQDQKNGSAAVAHGALLTWATTFVAALSMF
ncbi:hypothetical protein BGW38_007286 [Lunasporangiospora selenospora]|uniref:NodB homology domain-containing protein n=1 Tax=Lunasporangiospora selenospora TaxID=979761 RepID=A0A9P6KGU2_9FUNG|nr:hypothetical protein BGW38_007286 [Lunasporangiospora selenospora]